MKQSVLTRLQDQFIATIGVDDSEESQRKSEEYTRSLAALNRHCVYEGIPPLDSMTDEQFVSILKYLTTKNRPIYYRDKKVVTDFMRFLVLAEKLSQVSAQNRIESVNDLTRYVGYSITSKITDAPVYDAKNASYFFLSDEHLANEINKVFANTQAYNMGVAAMVFSWMGMTIEEITSLREQDVSDSCREVVIKDRILTTPEYLRPILQCYRTSSMEWSGIPEDTSYLLKAENSSFFLKRCHNVRKQDYKTQVSPVNRVSVYIRCRNVSAGISHVHRRTIEVTLNDVKECGFLKDVALYLKENPTITIGKFISGRFKETRRKSILDNWNRRRAFINAYYDEIEQYLP